MEKKVFEKEAEKRGFYYEFYPHFRLILLQNIIAETEGKPNKIPNEFKEEHPAMAPYLDKVSGQRITDRVAMAVDAILKVPSTRLYLEALLICKGYAKEKVIADIGITPEIFDFFTYLIFDPDVFKGDYQVYSYLQGITDTREKTIKSLAYKYGPKPINYIFGRKELDITPMALADNIYTDAAVKALHSSLYGFDSEEALKASSWGSKAMHYITSLKNAFKDEKSTDHLSDIIDKIEFNRKDLPADSEAKKFDPTFNIE